MLYVKKADRPLLQAEQRALAHLQSVLDSPDASQADRQAAANRILDFLQAREKSAPIRAALGAQGRLRRAAERRCRVLAEELESVKRQFATSCDIDALLKRAEQERTNGNRTN